MNITIYKKMEMYKRVTNKRNRQKTNPRREKDKKKN